MVWPSVGRPHSRRGNGMTRPPVEVLEGRQLLSQVFTVTDTLDDTNPGSLRWAIGQVNADATDTAADPNQIRFDIPTSDPGYNITTGVWTIAVSSALPTVGRSAMIDGYTQTGAKPNDSLTSDDAVLKIELRANGTVLSDGLTIAGGSSTVSGLAIGGFLKAGVRLTGAGGDVIAGNFLGSDAGGASALGGDYGVLVQTSGNTIGGTTLAARNVTNGGNDIIVNDGSSNLIAGNFVGVTASGSSSFDQESFIGISLAHASGNTVGVDEVAAAA